MEKVAQTVNFDFWQLIFGICAWHQKWWILTEWVRSHCSLIGPLKVVKNSLKVPILVKKGYAMEKVTQISSRIIHLKIKKSLLYILGHFGHLWVFLKKPEPFKKCQNESDCPFAAQRDCRTPTGIQLFGWIGSKREEISSTKSSVNICLTTFLPNR